MDAKRRKPRSPGVPQRGVRTATGTMLAGEDVLDALLGMDPNDEESFTALAEMIGHRVATECRGIDPRRAVTCSSWALAEKLAASPRAWMPLLVLGRMSIAQDRDAALKRLRTACERDPSGTALLRAVRILREAGQAREAIALGIGNWRPATHCPEVGQELILAAIEENRVSEVRQYFRALAGHPDGGAAAGLCVELDRLTNGGRAHIDLQDDARTTCGVDIAGAPEGTPPSSVPI
jgi:hypothetical protein